MTQASTSVKNEQPVVFEHQLTSLEDPKIPWVTCFDPKRRKRHATSEILKESEKALEEERRKADSEQTLGTSWIAIQHYLTKPTKTI